MSQITQGEWKIGYGPGGITGPTCPVGIGPTVGEAIEVREGKRVSYSTIVGVDDIFIDAHTCRSVIAIVVQRGDDTAERDANARLISAAPKLMAAIRRLLNCPAMNEEEEDDETREAIQQALAAIALTKEEST